MARVAAQAQESRRLMQQVVRHGTMWIVTYGTVFLDRRMLIDERALFVGVTSITNHIDCV
jgi:hypothetical protein